MTKDHGLIPEWISAPGDTISDVLDARGLSVDAFAQAMARPADEIRGLLRGREPVTAETACDLARVLGSSQEFWTSREAQYREDLLRFERTLDSNTLSDWIRSLPVNDMTKLGWLARSASASDKAIECLRFFGVPTVEAWQNKCAELIQTASFRTSRTFKSEPGAVAAWIRQGELAGSAIECRRWNADAFRNALTDIRRLSRGRDLHVQFPTLQKRCSDCGVAVVIVRAPSKCRASGAVRALPRDRKLILLSFRHLSDDHFWFTFFHEAGHLLLHGDRPLFIDGEDDVSSAEEQEANQFAEETLVPPERREEMLALPIKARAIIRFARAIGVSPGIVVGQLQFYKRIRPNQLNVLRTRYAWE